LRQDTTSNHEAQETETKNGRRFIQAAAKVLPFLLILTGYS
jgi:hypothetical protein